MSEDRSISRRALVAAGVGAAVASAGVAKAQGRLAPLTDLDPIRTELVMNVVVTCSAPEPMSNPQSKDGRREVIWPIVGGRFEGPNIRGQVIPGGGDFPVMRPDGVMIIDALYRLRTDDGVTLIIHNRGLAYPRSGNDRGKYRLVPEFTVPQGKYDWLNKSIFLCTLMETPPAMALAKGPNENDRLLQIHRVL